MIPTPPQDKDFPYWLVAVSVIGGWMVWRVLSEDIYSRVLDTLLKGVTTTIYVAFISYAMACILGLILAIMAVSGSVILRQISRFYVEVMRGVPIIVLLLYVAFVFAPSMVAGWNWLTGTIGIDPIRNRDFSMLWRAIIALTLAYASFLAEVFRAGILAVDHGQIEAAQALGLNKFQRFRHIIFPQALKMILPPLGNDFVAMVKDSSLVSVLGVADVTQLGKLTAAGNFRYFETYNVVALIYLLMTISLSLLLRRFEARMRSRP